MMKSRYNEKVILFTGLVRDESKFLDALKIIEKGNAKIIFSTWHGELKSYKRLTNKLIDLNAVIVESYPPQLIIPGHLLHQLFATFRGLQNIDENSFVYKTRPDFVNLHSLATFLDENYNPEPVNDSSSQFTAKVGIQSLFLGYPFYFNDMTYWGLSRDLIKILTYSVLSEQNFPNTAPEQMLWTSNYIAASKVLRDYLMVNCGALHFQKEAQEKLANHNKSSLVFIRAFVEQYKVFKRDFTMFPRLDRATNLSDYTLEEILWKNINLDVCYYREAVACNTWRTKCWLTALENETLKSSDMSDLFYETLKSEKSSSLDELIHEADCLTEKLNVKFNAMPNQINDTNMEYPFYPARWKIREPSGESHDLEIQNNILRRRINELEKKLTRK